MKPILSIALLLAMGCASKPKPTEQFVIWALPNNSGGVTVVFEDPVVHHVTREQWEAAQGLYVNVRIGCDDPHHTVEGCREIIFDPSKAAK